MIHRVNYAQLVAQERAAFALMDRMSDYARSIGCVVIDDEIQCTAAQAEQITTWWRENTHGEH